MFQGLKPAISPFSDTRTKVRVYLRSKDKGSADSKDKGSADSKDKGSADSKDKGSADSKDKGSADSKDESSADSRDKSGADASHCLLLRPDDSGVAEADYGNSDKDRVEAGKEGVEPGADCDADRPHA